MRHIGVEPWVRLADAGEREHGHEITYWKLPDGRTLLFVCMNPETRGTSLGGGNSVGLKAETLPIRVRLTRSVRDTRDERSGRALGDGSKFALVWKQNEAVVLSFDAK